MNIIFQQPSTARFLCRKLYKYFLDEYPDDATVESWPRFFARTTTRSGRCSAPFLSTRFMDPNYRGALVSDPIDRTVGSMRTQGRGDRPDRRPRRVAPEGAWTLYLDGRARADVVRAAQRRRLARYRNWLNSLTLPWRKAWSTATSTASTSVCNRT
ncbi:MAG: DUF1800 family protein [Candidatus Eisenbacteria bacterium]